MVIYRHIEKGRSLYSLSVIIFMAGLTVVFIVMGGLLWIGPGLLLAVTTLSGIYAFLKNETASLIVRDSILSWSYPRWPKSQGSIDLRSVRKVVLSDRSGTLLFTFADGTSREIKLIGDARQFQNYLKEVFPEIKSKLVEGS